MGDTNYDNAFCCFLDDDNKECSGYFDIVELNQAYVKLRTRGSILIIPIARVKKIKIKGDQNE